MGWCSKCQDTSAYASISACANITDDNVDTAQCSISYGHGRSLGLLHEETTLGPAGAGQGVENISIPLLNVDATRILDSTDATGIYLLTTLSNATYLDIMNPVIALGHVTVKIRDDVDAAIVNYTDPPAGNSLEIVAAEECVLSICESEIVTAVINGTVSVKNTAENFGNIQQYFHDDQDMDAVTCWSPKSTSTVMSHPISGNASASTLICPIGLTEVTANVITVEAAPITTSYADVLGSVIPGNNTIYVEQLSSRRNETTTLTANNYSSSVSAYIADHGLAITLEDIAASLTHLNQTANTTEVVSGTAYVNEIYLSVTWYWLILPVSLVIGAVLLSIIAAVQSRRCHVKLWKSSLLPLLYRKVWHTVVADRGVPDTVSGMMFMAGKETLRLRDSSALMGQDRGLM